MKPIHVNLHNDDSLNEPSEPLRLEPDDPDEIENNPSVFRARAKSRSAESNGRHSAHAASDQTKTEMPAQGQASAASNAEPLQWALDALHQPAMASADWLARDIDPAHPTAVDLLSNPSITIEQVRQAKAVFKTMRIVGEKAADRRVGARMYAAAIAAGLVRFKRRISTQSDEALKRGFQGLLDDRRMPQPLRDLAGQALCVLAELNGRDALPDQLTPRSKSA